MFSFLEPYKVYAELLAVVLALVTTFTLGWKTKGWHDDSLALAENAQVDKVMQQFHQHESVVASTLEDKLSQLKANEKVIEHESVKIVDRPVYNNICLDPDGLLLLNKARGGQNSDTSKPAG